MRGARLMVIVAVLMVCAGSLAAQRRPLAMKVGYKERWVFAMAGKQIGDMGGECVAARTAADATGLMDFRYDLKMDLPVQGQQIKLTMNGTFTLTDKGSPTAMTLNAMVNGQPQKLVYQFAGGKASASINANGQAMKNDVAITGSEFLSINNVMTLMSLATRTLGLQPGKSATAPFFAAESMKKVDITFAARPKSETIQVGGKTVECLVCDVSPIAAKIHVDKATGEMVRYAMDAQKLVITRQ